MIECGYRLAVLGKHGRRGNSSWRTLRSFLDRHTFQSRVPFSLIEPGFPDD
jgi:hypothetical protein